MSIFKAYDIRGRVPDELDVVVAEHIGNAVARYFVSGTLAVGRDARNSSPRLHSALVRGITKTGLNVADIGCVTTPMLYHAVEEFGLRGGVMVTASHNPAEYNGFKICGPHAIPVGVESGLREIENFTETISDSGRSIVNGEVEIRDVLPSYAERVLGIAKERAPLRVVLDAGNGVAGIGLEAVLARLGIDPVRLFFELDGNFPNHPADPLNPDNLSEARASVCSEHADFGVAFDGDADRAIFIDEKGEIVSADLVTALLARDQLSKRPGGRVLYDLRSSLVTPEEIEIAGGIPEMCRVGHSFVKERMHKTGAIFAGELSGHYYFRFTDNHVADDATAALVSIISLLASTRMNLSELIDPLRRYHASGEINRRIVDPAEFVEKVAGLHRNAPELHRLDGVLVRYEDWWFNLRSSNTEPVVRLNVEAKRKDRMETERDKLIGWMELAANVES